MKASDNHRYLQRGIFPSFTLSVFASQKSHRNRSSHCSFCSFTVTNLETIGKQKCGTGWNGCRECGICMTGDTDGSKCRTGCFPGQGLLAPVVVGGIVYTCIMQVLLNRLAALTQVHLQNFKFFFCHDTITVVDMCTIATAKVQRNYNC